ncbi:MAG: extracellular solute-binding protein [Acidobacteriaceae bacterium]|nr:extracellular solute-binding protein [Acidobacteriaceae bacterium]
MSPIKLSNVVAILVAFLLCVAPGCSKQPVEPVTLTFLDVEWDTPDRLPELAQDLQDFTKETGIRVKRLPRPDGSLDELALWRQQLEKGAAGPDLVSIDVIWSAMLSAYLMDLKPYFADELHSQNPAVLSSYTAGDKVVAIPHHAYVGVLFYRPDLLRKYGYDEPPATWDELESMSARIQAGERARGEKDFWGYVWQGAIDEDLTCRGLEWQVSQGGGRIIEDDKTISVDNPQTIKAWQRATRWVGSISPPGVVAYSKWDAQNLWGSGRAAFLHGWESNYSLITRGWPFPQAGSHTVPDKVRQFGITSVPGGTDGRVSSLGGNGLALSQGSRHPHEAMQLMRFLLRRDQQLMRQSAQSEVPQEASLYELPVALNPYPQVGELNQNGGVVVPRPSVAAGDKYEEVTKAYIEAVHSVLTKNKTASTAAADLETQLIQITGFRKGPPVK